MLRDAHAGGIFRGPHAMPVGGVGGAVAGAAPAAALAPAGAAATSLPSASASAASLPSAAPPALGDAVRMTLTQVGTGASVSGLLSPDTLTGSDPTVALLLEALLAAMAEHHRRHQGSSNIGALLAGMALGAAADPALNLLGQRYGQAVAAIGGTSGAGGLGAFLHDLSARMGAAPLQGSVLSVRA